MVASAVSKTRLPLEMLGVDDRYGTCAENYDALLKHYGLEPQDIADKVRSVLA